MTTQSHWLLIAEAYVDLLVDEGISGVDVAPDPPDPPDAAEMNIRIQKAPYLPRGLLGQKALIIFPQNEVIQPSSNREDLIGYGIGTLLCWPSNNDFTTGLDEFLYWRELCRNTLLPLGENILSLSSPRIETATWEPNAVYDLANFGQQYDTQAFTMRYWVNEDRQSRP